MLVLALGLLLPPSAATADGNHPSPAHLATMAGFDLQVQGGQAGAGQTGSGEARDDKKPANAPTPASKPELTKSEAKSIQKSFSKAYKSRQGLAEQTAAVELFAKGRHDLFVGSLRKVVQTSAHATVRNRAAELIADQPEDVARAAIVALIADDKVCDNAPAAARLVDGLRRLGVAPDTRRGLGQRGATWKRLTKLFDSCGYRAEFVPLQKSIIALATADQATEAIDLLVANVDEPAPEDVHGAANPPAEYWEARWKAWQAWREDAKKALIAITGQRFSTGKEAKIWLERNRKALEQNVARKRLARAMAAEERERDRKRRRRQNNRFGRE